MRFFLILLAAAAAFAAGPSKHEPLRQKNEFKTPLEVLRYYCERDAGGFVWTGMLDSERKAFTTWKHAPAAESYFIAKSYELVPLPQKDPDHARPDIAKFEARYAISGMGDASGAKMAPPEPTRTVSFELRKVRGIWKIDRPEAQDISPVLVDPAFRFEPK